MKKYIYFLLVGIIFFSCEPSFSQSSVSVTKHVTGKVYRLNELTSRNGIIYRALVQNNTTPPSTDWVNISTTAGSGAGNINDGSIVGSIPIWNGTSWVETAFVNVDGTGDFNITEDLIVVGAITGSNLSGTNTGDQTAATTSFTPAGSIIATDVQAAIEELDADVQVGEIDPVFSLEEVDILKTNEPKAVTSTITYNTLPIVNATTAEIDGVGDLSAVNRRWAVEFLQGGGAEVDPVFTAAQSGLVNTTDAQTVNGIKTFSSPISGVDAIAVSDLVTLQQLNNATPNETDPVYVSEKSTLVQTTGNQTIAGVKTFSSTISGVDGVANTDLVTKQQLDGIEGTTAIGRYDEGAGDTFYPVGYDRTFTGVGGAGALDLGFYDGLGSLSPTQGSLGTQSFSMGYNNKNEGYGAFMLGQDSDIPGSGTYAIAIGTDNSIGGYQGIGLGTFLTNTTNYGIQIGHSIDFTAGGLNVGIGYALSETTALSDKMVFLGQANKEPINSEGFASNNMALIIGAGATTGDGSTKFVRTTPINALTIFRGTNAGLVNLEESTLANLKIWDDTFPHAAATVEYVNDVVVGSQGIIGSDEGSGVGFVRYNDTRTDKGIIGASALDLSGISGSPNVLSAPFGATNTLSFAMGLDNQATGYGSFAMGEENLVSGTHAFGSGVYNRSTNYANFTVGARNNLTGLYSSAIGISNWDEGVSSFMMGMALRAGGSQETTIVGRSNVVPSTYLSGDRVNFIVGTGTTQGDVTTVPNGATPLVQQDGFRVFEGGLVTAPSQTTALINANTDALITKAYADVTYLGGSESDPIYTASDAASITAQNITDLGNLSGTNSGDQIIPVSGVDFDPVGTDNSDDNAANTLYVNDYRAANFVAETDYSAQIHSNITALNAVSGTNTGDQDISGIGVNAGNISTNTTAIDTKSSKSIVPLLQAAAYTTVTADNAKHIIMSTSDLVTLDDAGVTINDQFHIYNMSGGDISFAFGTGDGAYQGTLPVLGDGLYAWCTLTAADTWSVIIGGSGGGGGSSTLSGLDDTDITSPTNDQVLQYKTGTGKWEASTLAGTGDMTKSTYDTNANDVVDNAETVNNLTVLTAVPGSAIFTDNQIASEVPFTPTGNTASNQLQAAIEELQTEIDALSVGGGGDVFLANNQTFTGVNQFWNNQGIQTYHSTGNNSGFGGTVFIGDGGGFGNSIVGDAQGLDFTIGNTSETYTMNELFAVNQDDIVRVQDGDALFMSTYDWIKDRHDSKFVLGTGWSDGANTKVATAATGTLRPNGYFTSTVPTTYTTEITVFPYTSGELQVKIGNYTHPETITAAGTYRYVHHSTGQDDSFELIPVVNFTGTISQLEAQGGRVYDNVSGDGVFNTVETNTVKTGGSIITFEADASYPSWTFDNVGAIGGAQSFFRLQMSSFGVMKLEPAYSDGGTNRSRLSVNPGTQAGWTQMNSADWLAGEDGGFRYNKYMSELTASTVLDEQVLSNPDISAQGKTFWSSSATAINLTLPDIDSDLYPGWHIEIIQKGTGQITLLSDFGDDMLVASGFNAIPKTRAQYSVIYVTMVDGNYIVSGDLAP